MSILLRNWNEDLFFDFLHRDLNETRDRKNLSTLSDALLRPSRERRGSNSSGLSYQVKDNVLSLEFDLPGVRKEDLFVEMNKHLLKVSGNREKNRVYDYEFLLDSSLWNENPTEKTFENGVLRLVFEKKKSSNSKFRIEL